MSAPCSDRIFLELFWEGPHTHEGLAIVDVNFIIRGIAGEILVYNANQKDEIKEQQLTFIVQKKRGFIVSSIETTKTLAVSSSALTMIRLSVKTCRYVKNPHVMFEKADGTFEHQKLQEVGEIPLSIRWNLVNLIANETYQLKITNQSHRLEAVFDKKHLIQRLLTERSSIELEETQKTFSPSNSVSSQITEIKAPMTETMEGVDVVPSRESKEEPKKLCCVIS